MIGLWLEARQLSLRRDLALPRPAPGEALVRVLQAGICNTDAGAAANAWPAAFARAGEPGALKVLLEMAGD